mgnify:CR=1 FL=1
MPEEARFTWRHLRAFMPWLRPYAGRVAFALALLLLAKVVTVSVPLLLRNLVDALESGAGQAVLDPAASLATWPLLLVLAYGVARLSSSLFTEIRDVLFARVRYGMMRQISVAVLDHLHRLSLRYHLERRSGALHSDVTRGSQSFSSLLNTVGFQILPTLVELALVLSILFYAYRPAYGLVTLVSAVAYVGFTFGLTEWRLRFRVAMNAADAKAGAVAMDSLLNYETVQLFGNQRWEVDRYDHHLQAWEDASVKSQSTLGLLNAGQAFVIAGGVTVSLWLAAQDVLRGALSLGDFVAIHAFLLQLFLPLGFLGMLYSMFKHAISDMGRMLALLEREPEVEDAPHARPLEPGPGALRLEGVVFWYRSDQPILRGIDLSLRPGERVAIVGESGSGKSTIARLLFRLFDPIEGRILLDGQDLRDLRVESLRAAISVVPQDTVLFHDTLAYNLRYGRLDASDEALWAAADAAQLGGMLQRLPDGMETLVGERGLKLSGGEKQRVAIARALLKRSRLVILDEATSSLDNVAERAIVEASKTLFRDRTTLVIAHRLSTIVDCDRIVVLAGGRVVEQGDHATLLALGGHYAELWRTQEEAAAARQAATVEP